MSQDNLHVYNPDAPAYFLIGHNAPNGGDEDTLSGDAGDNDALLK